MATKAETDFATVATYLTAIGKQMTDGIGAVETEVNTLQTGLAALTLTVKGLVASVAALSSGTMITGTGPSLPPGVTANSLPVVSVAPGTTYPTISAALLAVANKGTVNVAPSRYNETFHVDGGIFPGGLTIQGQVGMAYETIIDGTGLRLAWNNGVVHTTAPLVLANVTVTGASNGTQTSTGQAGIYCVHPVGTTVSLENCAIFGNQANGVQGAAGSGILSQDNCEFGFNKPAGTMMPNGLPDGLSHDYYAQGSGLSETNCRHYDCALGHGGKIRAPILKISGNDYIRSGGRWLDIPDGTASTATIEGCTLTDLPGAAANGIGYADESTANGHGGLVFDACDIAISRFATVFWNNDPATLFTLNANCVVTAFDQPGVAGPTLVLQGLGAFVGFPATLPAPTSALPVPASTI